MDTATDVEIIFDNPYIWMVYHTDSMIIHHHYYPQLTSHYFRAGLDTGIEVMKEHGAVKWLSDNSELEPHSPEDAEWTNNDWLPRAVEAGWKYWALVVPHTTAAQMNMAQFVQTFFEFGVRVQVFTDVDEAMGWLQSR